MGRIVCFGEVMLRLGPEGYYRFHQADRFVLNYTGAEANAAVALSQFGMETEVVTKLPDHAIAKAAVAELKKFGAGTRFIQFGGERMGVYFIEKGASQRPSKVIYDRKNTSISAVRPGEFDWGTIFEGASAFLFSGVTAALSDTIPDVLAEACEKAKEKGVKIFCDLNYRKNLWTPEKAQVTMKRLVKYVDVLVGNEEDSEKMLGVKAGASDVHKGELDTASYVDVAKQLQREYGFEAVGTTLRKSISASDNKWSGMLYTNGTAYLSREYDIRIVDRVGGGDSFTSGLMYAMLNGYDSRKALEFAAAASCLKQSIELDFNLVSVEEITALMEGDGSGRVQR